jgi:FKBP-type peptidyl-prolyl cis-trans isomerase
MKIINTILAAAVLLASCNQYEKTKSGLAYKITGSSKEKLKQGQFVKLNIEYKMKVGSKDSILKTTFDHIPAYIQVDSARGGKHDFPEVITKLGVGDKLDFVMSIDTLKKLQMIPDYNNIFTKGGVIKGRVEVIKVFATEPDVNADYQKEIETEKQKEIKAVESFVAKKGIKTQKTPAGVLVEIENAGDSQNKIDSGKQASVYYKGSLENGKEFDSNIKNGVKGQPFNLVIGSHSVIPGWEEGLKMFGKGGKGKLYIPAFLAYWAQGMPPAIPSFSNLVFEIEIADVTTPAPAATVQPGTDPNTNPALQEQINKLKQQAQQQHH